MRRAQRERSPRPSCIHSRSPMGSVHAERAELVQRDEKTPLAPLAPCDTESAKRLRPEDRCHSEEGAAQNRLHAPVSVRRPKNLYRERAGLSRRGRRSRQDRVPIVEILRSAHRQGCDWQGRSARLSQNDTVRFICARFTDSVSPHFRESLLGTVRIGLAGCWAGW